MTSVISAYVYDRPRSVEKQSMVVVVSPLVEDQVADVIDDVLKLRNHPRHPTQLGIWQSWPQLRNHCAIAPRQKRTESAVLLLTPWAIDPATGRPFPGY